MHLTIERQTKDMIEFEKDNIKAYRDVLKIDNDYQYYFSDINASIASLSRYKRNLKIILKKMGELKQVYFDV